MLPQVTSVTFTLIPLVEKNQCDAQEPDPQYDGGSMLKEDCVWCSLDHCQPVVFTHVVGGRLKSTCCSTCWLIVAILSSEETVSRIGGTVHAWYLLSFEVDLLFNSLARNPRSTSEESCILSCSRLVSSAGVGGKLVAQLVCLLLQPHYDFRSSLLVVLLLNNS